MKQSILWSLKKENHQDSFVLGTMHVKSESAFRRIDELKHLISLCDVFAAEYDLDKIAKQENQAHLLLPDGLRLQDFFSRKKYNRIQKQILKSFALNLQLLSRFQPLILVNLISETALSKDYKLPLDMHLWNFAQNSSLDTIGIETFESQVDIISKIKLEDQCKMLTQIARNPGKFKRNIAKMAELYKAEEILKLYKNGKKSLGKYRGILLKKRNFIMANRFEEISLDYKTFYAIGAGHLAGKNGVLKILKDKNWKVKAI